MCRQVEVLGYLQLYLLKWHPLVSRRVLGCHWKGHRFSVWEFLPTRVSGRCALQSCFDIDCKRVLSPVAQVIREPVRSHQLCALNPGEHDMLHESMSNLVLRLWYPLYKPLNTFQRALQLIDSNEHLKDQLLVVSSCCFSDDHCAIPARRLLLSQPGNSH